MGWEERSGRRYYYRKARHPGGRVVSEYVGSGEFARLCAALDRQRAAEAEALAAEARAAREEGAALDAACDRLARFAQTYTRAALATAGFRQHKGQWRRRRRRSERTMTPKKTGAARATAEAPAEAPATEAALAPAAGPTRPVRASARFGLGGTVRLEIDGSDGVPPDDDLAAVEALVARCNTAEPDPADLDVLRLWLARDGVMLRAEDLAEDARRAALGAHRGAALGEFVLAGLSDLRARLLGPGEAPAVEGLLVEQACTAWLVLQVEQARLGRLLATPGGYSVDAADALDRRVSRANTRFLRAVEALERVRALRRRYPDALRAETPSGNEVASQPSEESAGGHAGDGAARACEAAELVLSIG